MSGNPTNQALAIEVELVCRPNAAPVTTSALCTATITRTREREVILLAQ